MAVASAGPYANHLHPLIQTDNHASTSSLNFLQARCSFWRPSNSVKALKANKSQQRLGINRIFHTGKPSQFPILPELMEFRGFVLIHK